MLQSAWLFLGVLGAAALAVSYLTVDDDVGIVSGALAVVVWALFGYGALNVQMVTDSGTTAMSMPALAMLGGVLAALALLPVLRGPVGLFRQSRSNDPFEQF